MSLAWTIRGVLFAALAPVGMAACGGSDPETETRGAASTAPPTRTAQPTATDAPARVTVGRSRLGPILVDANGRSLYFFTQDKPRRALCTSDYLNCTTAWPPLMTTGRPRGQAGLKARLLGSIHRTKPTGSQVTYNRHPLYLYVEDTKPGDVKGQGMFNYWYVLAPSGRPIRKK
jgi:predicted lipoprotein with Yx(FWY)xxD motif